MSPRAGWGTSGGATRPRAGRRRVAAAARAAFGDRGSGGGAGALAPLPRGTCVVNNAVPGRRSTTSCSTSSGSNSRSSTGMRSSDSGRRIAIPSSLHRTWTSSPECAERRAFDRHGPRRVHPRAERREHAHAPVAELVGEAFDDDRAIVRHDAGRLPLILEIRREVLRRELVETQVRAQAFDRAVVRCRSELAGDLADRTSELDRSAGLVAVPERHLARLAGRRRDDRPGPA